MRTVLVLLLVVASCGAAAPAYTADPAKLVAAKRALADATDAETPEALIRARASFEALSMAEPKSAALHYWIAVAAWRLTPRLEDKKHVERFCRDGIAHADQALALDPNFAEAIAIKAALQGISLRFVPQDMMTLGMEMEQSFSKAMEKDPKNPRVRLLEAINTLHKPDFVGGGAKAALSKFVETQELFAAESPADSTAPDWGHDEALLWAGRATMALEDPVAAKEFYEKALAVNPKNSWVRNVLLPQAEKALAAKREKKDES